jgi:hypothetical protein
VGVDGADASLKGDRCEKLAYGTDQLFALGAARAMIPLKSVRNSLSRDSKARELPTFFSTGREPISAEISHWDVRIMTCPMSDDPVRAETLFLAAVEIAEPQARAAFLDRECGDNLTLRARVDGLLASHDEAGNFLESAQPSTRLEAEFARLKPEEAGERIGRYKLLQQIGEGGFGVAWMAEQEQPVRRRVALKIIKLGMDTKEVIARFEQERQALAMMDHPNIAKVFDAGATPFGRPYFVMELVRGIRITGLCLD